MSDDMKKLTEKIDEVVEESDLRFLTKQQRIDITKEALRQVIQEWLDDRAGEFGRWSIKRIALGLFAAAIYFWLTHSGWSLK